MVIDTVSPLIYGLDDAPMASLPDSRVQVHRAVLHPLQQLREDAVQAGFDLQVASGYRGFDRQLHIWNAKARGERPLLDSAGRPMVAASLPERERVYAILRWSALPGASRHHWGTDMDVYDAARLPEACAPQLTVDETRGSGPFAPLHRWLDEYLESPANPGFFRPYAEDRGGIAPEPWHLSYAPLAESFASQLSVAGLRARLQDVDIELKPVVLEHLDDIFTRFISVPPWG
jgi:LAS superfamily LD-carboxypeptidase LdcB